MDLHSVTMDNEYYMTSNKRGKVPLKTAPFLPENLMKKHAWVTEEEESW